MRRHAIPGVIRFSCFNQIQQMCFVQPEKSCRRGAIAVSLRERSYNDVSFSDLHACLLLLQGEIVLAR
jgi:hypothetical protein